MKTVLLVVVALGIALGSAQASAGVVPKASVAPSVGCPWMVNDGWFKAFVGIFK